MPRPRGKRAASRVLTAAAHRSALPPPASPSVCRARPLPSSGLRRRRPMSGAVAGRCGVFLFWVEAEVVVVVEEGRTPPFSLGA